MLDGSFNRRRTTLSERKKYRTWMVAQRFEIVLAGLRGEMSVAEVCREHQISETLFYSWRERLLEGGAGRLAGKEERTESSWSCVGGCVTWSARSARRPMSLRSGETGSGRGSERSRRLRLAAVR